MLPQDAMLLPPLLPLLAVLQPLTLRLRLGHISGWRAALPALPQLRSLDGRLLVPLLLPEGGCDIICASSNLAFNIGISTGPAAG